MKVIVQSLTCILALAITTAAPARSFAAENDIVDTAVAAGSFKTLAAALTATDLVDTLKGDGPFTVFAPTDEAFGKLPKGTVESLLKPENRGKLISILKYHVVDGRILADQAVAAGEAGTLQGEVVRIKIRDGGVYVNDSGVVANDITASNGVIHVIDSVLLPPEKAASTADPRRMMETTVAHGARLYNAGHVGQCAKLYRIALMTVLSSNGEAMPAHAAQTVQAALHKAEQTHCVDTQAWVLRHGINVAYRAMSPTVAATAAQ